MGNFLLPEVVMIKTWGRVLLGGMSKQVQFFGSQVYFPVTLTPWVWNVFATMVGYTGLIEKKIKKYSGEINPLGVHRNIRGCILELNSEGLGWQAIALKSSLDLHFHPFIIKFRIEKKIHTKAVVDVSRGAGGRVFLFSWEILRERNLFSHGFTNRGCLHCAILSLQDKRYAIFPSICLKWDFQDFENV